jgi:hypothetical protein
VRQPPRRGPRFGCQLSVAQGAHRCGGRYQPENDPRVMPAGPACQQPRRLVIGEVLTRKLRFAGSFTVRVMPTTPTAPTAATELARASSPFASCAAVAPTEAAADAAPRGSIRARIRPAWVANQVRNSAGGAPRQNGSRTMRRNSIAPARRLITAALIEASSRSTTEHESNHEPRAQRHACGVRRSAASRSTTRDRHRLK